MRAINRECQKHGRFPLSSPKKTLECHSLPLNRKRDGEPLTTGRSFQILLLLPTSIHSPPCLLCLLRLLAWLHCRAQKGRPQREGGGPKPTRSLARRQRFGRVVGRGGGRRRRGAHLIATADNVEFTYYYRGHWCGLT